MIRPLAVFGETIECAVTQWVYLNGPAPLSKYNAHLYYRLFRSAFFCIFPTVTSFTVSHLFRTITRTACFPPSFGHRRGPRVGSLSRLRDGETVVCLWNISIGSQASFRPRISRRNNTRILTYIQRLVSISSRWHLIRALHRRSCIVVTCEHVSKTILYIYTAWPRINRDVRDVTGNRFDTFSFPFFSLGWGGVLLTHVWYIFIVYRYNIRVYIRDVRPMFCFCTPSQIRKKNTLPIALICPYIYTRINAPL